MTERIIFPKIPRWCEPCRNRLNDLCVEECAPSRDACHFEPKKVDIEDLGPFPRDEFVNEMGGDERKVCIAFYMEKLVDQAQGRRSVKVDITHNDIFLSEI